MAPNRITLVAHTHWDREWYEPFEIFRAHLVEMLDEALALMEADERLHFTLDGQVALVDDYLEVRPGAALRLRALVAQGRLHVGPWYTQADTLLVDGESLIRNLAEGMRRASELGRAMRVGYMPDQFGHCAQMPQILRSFGIDGAVLWRGVGPDRPPHAFLWTAPDGSAVTTAWLQDGYGSGRRIPSDAAGFAAAVLRSIERLNPWLGEMPVLVPIGDDHVRIAHWLPEAAEALRARLPETDVQIGGYQDHMPHLGAITHSVHGELRSPVFAPVLAGVASARLSEKQAAARCATLLLRYAEPLAVWARLLTVAGESPSQDLMRRAWRMLFHNHAHDSAAGCGVDAAHEDVKTRYRWVEQLARAAIDRSLARLRFDAPADAAAHIVLFHPGPASATTFAEAHVPRSLTGPLEAVGADGLARPVQALGDSDEAPLFEGEFAPADLNQYLGGLDPATPLFGKYLTGIAIREEPNGVVRLDVGLGETPAPRGALAADQERVAALVTTAARFRVVLHSSAPTRPVLVQAGPAPAAGFVSLAVRPGTGVPDLSAARKLTGVTGIAAGPLSAIAEADGSVLIHDQRFDLPPLRANWLVDEGDRGDLYHFDPVAPALSPRLAAAKVIEEGPLRARLRIEQEIELPVALDVHRRGRSATTRRVQVVTEVTLHAGEHRVELVTAFDNTVSDHRLRALVDLPFVADHLDVEHGLAVVARPLEAAALGHGSERAAPTGQHHGFVDVGDVRVGVALLSRGLPEHEVLARPGGSSLALTLVRSVGWLSRGDLSVIEHAAGPVVATPGAQEQGPHRCEYALVMHAGDWLTGALAAEAARYAAPSLAVRGGGPNRRETGVSLLDVSPGCVAVSALHPARERGMVARIVNLSRHPVDAILRTAWPLTRAQRIDPLEEPIDDEPLPIDGGAVTLPLRPWQIVTVSLQ